MTIKRKIRRKREEGRVREWRGGEWRVERRLERRGRKTSLKDTIKLLDSKTIFAPVVHDVILSPNKCLQRDRAKPW